MIGHQLYLSEDYLYVCVDTHVHVYMHTHIHKYVYTHIYIYLYVPARTQSNVLRQVTNLSALSLHLCKMVI